MRVKATVATFVLILLGLTAAPFEARYASLDPGDSGPLSVAVAEYTFGDIALRPVAA